jgi:hypothetical protein
MKIEDTVSIYPTQSAAAAVLKKLQPTASADFWADSPDLSFLDLLTALPSENTTPQSALLAEKTVDDGKKAAEDASKTTTPTEKTPTDNVRRLPVSTQASGSVHHVSDSDGALDDFKMLSASDLSKTDVDYLKQAVIPNIPILMGNVPIQNVFPTTPEGEISYRGFNVSPPLSELIAHGYKTGRPIRVELDSDSAIVLKIRDGRVSAEFVSVEQSAALAMQNEFAELRNRLVARNLPVGTLEARYNPEHQQQQSRQKQQESSEE